MAEIEVHNVASKSLMLGNNEFEGGLLTIAAGGTIPAGAMLKRDAATGKFTVVTTTTGDTAETPVALNPCEEKNAGQADADIPFRALIWGKVRRDMASMNGTALTDAQCDMLRNYGIIAVKVHDISRTDNQ
jgi:hypothetical protein